MGPSMVTFLKEVNGRAKEADKILMSHQGALSPETHIEHGDRIVFLAHTLEYCVVGIGCRLPEPHYPLRQHPQIPRRGAAPHPDPNFAPHAAHRLSERIS